MSSMLSFALDHRLRGKASEVLTAFGYTVVKVEARDNGTIVKTWRKA